MPPADDQERPGTSRYIPLALCLALAALVLFRTPFQASQLPRFDAVFYVVAARRFVTDGHYLVQYADRVFPPLYPPGVSLCVLAPFYWLAPNELGIGVLGIFLTACGACYHAYRIGLSLGGVWAGAGAACALLACEEFRTWSYQQMSEVPTVFAMLACCASLIALRPESSVGTHLKTGLFFAFNLSLRAVNICTLGPLALAALASVRSGRARVASLAALGAPPAAMLIAMWAYNARHFGSPFRTAYHYWAPIPHEVGMSFGTRYFVGNLAHLLLHDIWMTALLGMTGALVLRLVTRASKDPEAARAQRSFYTFVALTGAAQSLLFLFYAWPGVRLNIVLIAFTSVLGGAGMGMALERLCGRRAPVLALGLAAAVCWAVSERLHGAYELVPGDRIHADRLRAVLPDDAVVVSRQNPFLVHITLIEGTHRTGIPLDRAVVVADMVVAPRRIGKLSSLPEKPDDYAYPAVLEAGAERPIPFTAEERPDVLEAALRAGRPVFLDTRFCLPDNTAVPALARRFRLEPVPGLEEVFRLRAK